MMQLIINANNEEAPTICPSEKAVMIECKFFEYEKVAPEEFSTEEHKAREEGWAATGEEKAASP